MDTIEYTILETAKLTGITASRLRVWQERYGWPCPNRNAYGYRAYSSTDIANLKRIKEFLDKGYAIGNLIQDGLPHIPEQEIVPRALVTKAHFASLPRPSSTAGIDFQANVIDALVIKDFAKVNELLQRSTRELRPSERTVACWDVIRLGLDKYKELNIDVSVVEDNFELVAMSRQ